MSVSRTVLATSGLDESWGPALRESGFVVKDIAKLEDAFKADADCVLVDARHPEGLRELGKLKTLCLSVVGSRIGHDEILRLQTAGMKGYLRDSVPSEELVMRVRAMLDDGLDSEILFKEARGSRRVWFQQLVHFKALDREHTAWSTTLSETGIFLHSTLNFPLYSVIRMKFELLGDQKNFECDGVIVRQESEGPIRGVGVMFQNLTGENVRILESFLQLHK